MLFDLSTALNEVLRVPGADGLIRSVGRSPGPRSLPTDDAVDPVLPSGIHRSQEGSDPERPVAPPGI